MKLLLAAGLLAAGLLGSGGPARAQAQEYRLDPVHTRILFAVDHAGLSTTLGTFSGATGTLSLDPDDWSTARVEASIPLARLDLGDEDWRDKMLERSFLDAATQPEARFVSTRIEPVDAQRARVIGTLSLRGRSREVALDVTLNALKRHPITRRRSAGFSATGEIDRRDFGMDSWPNVIGHRVQLRIEAEAIRISTDETKEAADVAPKQ
jgi:polyisoprenoid-binding protein YceI